MIYLLDAMIGYSEEYRIFIDIKDTCGGTKVKKLQEVLCNNKYDFSLEENHHFKVLPCVNDGNIELCNQNCNASHHAIVVKYGAETRNVCLLRASRLPWIIDIIKLAGKNDSSVNVWLKPGTGRQNGKLYLRYNHHGADFVLIFSVEKRFYRLISAFPVFYTNEKENFDKDYRKYAWSYFDT